MLGYTGGPALDAGHSFVTSSMRSSGYVGGPAGARVTRASLLDDAPWECMVSMVLARGAGGRTSQACWDA